MVRKYMETIQIRDDHTADITENATGEIKNEYDVVEDSEDEDGIRTIKIKVSQRGREAAVERRELVNALLEALGEKDSKAFSALLENVINVTGSEVIRDWYKSVVVEKQPVKTKKGCFEIVVGKGRRLTDRIPIFGGY